MFANKAASVPSTINLKIKTVMPYNYIFMTILNNLDNKVYDLQYFLEEHS
jgi:hypothetical protein